MASPVNPYTGVRPTDPMMPPRPAGSLQVPLNWQSLASQGNLLAGLGQDPQAAMAGLGNAYNQSYQNALGLNASLYEGLGGGYDALRQSVDDSYRSITEGYGQLSGDVLGRIAGSNQTRNTDINAASAAQQGDAVQSLISRGLGNSTITGSMQRGIENDRQRNLTASDNSFAQLGASYASNLGIAGLGARQQGVGLGANLGQAQLGALERTQIPYPEASQYAQLAQMYGANLEGQRNRQDLQDARQQMQGQGWGQAGPGVSGGSRGFAPQRQPSAFDYGGSYGGGAGGGGSDFGFGYGGGYGGSSSFQSPAGFYSGGGTAEDYYGANPGYSDPMAMGAIGGGVIGALGWGGYGTAPGGNPNAGYAPYDPYAGLYSDYQPQGESEQFYQGSGEGGLNYI